MSLNVLQPQLSVMPNVETSVQPGQLVLQRAQRRRRADDQRAGRARDLEARVREHAEQDVRVGREERGRLVLAPINSTAESGSKNGAVTIVIPWNDARDRDAHGRDVEHRARVPHHVVVAEAQRMRDRTRPHAHDRLVGDDRAARIGGRAGGVEDHRRVGDARRRGGGGHRVARSRTHRARRTRRRSSTPSRSRSPSTTMCGGSPRIESSSRSR